MAFSTTTPTDHTVDTDALDGYEKHGYSTPLSGEDTANDTVTDTEDHIPKKTTLFTKLEAADEILKEETQAHEGEDDMAMPTGLKLTLIMTGLCLSVFCLALDNTIIATAIPVITDQFKSLDDVGWYGSAYLLCTCAFQLFFGKLYKFYSIKLVYLIAIGIFELGSLVCGAAPNSKALIVGRAVAGLGAAGIFSGAILIIVHSVPLEKRPIFQGLVGAMYGIASVAGPLLGGVFTDKVTWRMCFYINLPIGLVTVVFIFFFFKAPNRKVDPMQQLKWRDQLRQLDLEGLASFLPAIICLLLALQWGGSTYAWKDARIIVLFVLFGVLIAVFIAVQFWKQDLGTLPPRLVKQRSVWSAAWFSFCLGAAFFIPVFYQPIWFQAIKGTSAVGSGIDSIPMVMGVVVASIISGAGVTIMGYYNPFVIAASILASVGAGLMSTFQVHTGPSMWIGYQVIFGFGIGIGLQLPMVAVQANLPAEDIPIGTVIVVFAQTIGGAVMLSVAENIFNNELVKGLTSSLPNLDPTVVLNAGATSLRSSAALAADLPAILVIYNHAITQTFFAAVALAALALTGALSMNWKSVKGQKLDMAAA